MATLEDQQTTLFTHQPSRLLLWLGLLPCICIVVGIVAIVLQPPAFASHREVIEYMLEQRGIHPLHVYVNQQWPDSENYYAYGSQVYPYHLNVEVHLANGSTVLGNVGCHRDIYQCNLTLVNLGFDRIAMPDIHNSRSNQLLDWLKQLFANIGITH